MHRKAKPAPLCVLSLLFALAAVARGQEDPLPDPLPALIGELESDRWQEREAAKEALILLGPEIEKPLEDLLARSPSPHLDAALRDVLGRTRGTYRWWHLSLGREGWHREAVELVTGAPATGPLIARLLAEKDPTVVERARRIERWAPTRATRPERPEARAVPRLEDIPDLLEKLGTLEGRELEGVALALAAMEDSRATPRVLAALPRIHDTSGLWDRLFSRPDPAMVAAYLQFQSDRRTWTWENDFLLYLFRCWDREGAARPVGVADAGRLLSEFIRDRFAGLASEWADDLGYDHVGRELVPAVLGAFDPGEVERAILAWIADPEPLTRRAAYYALGYWACPAAWDELGRRAVGLDSRELGLAVLAAVRSGGRAALEFCYEHAGRAYLAEKTCNVLPWYSGRVRPESIELIRRHSTHPTPWVAEHALRARVALEDETVWPELLEAVEAWPGPGFGPWAVYLARAGDERVREVVIAGLDDPDLRTVIHAAQIISGTELTGATAALRRLHAGHDPVRAAVARLTLALLGEEDAIEEMGPLLADPSSFFGLGRFHPDFHLGFGGGLEVPEWARYASEDLRNFFWPIRGVGARAESWYMRSILARGLAAYSEDYYDPSDCVFDPVEDLALVAVDLRRGYPLDERARRQVEPARLADMLARMGSDPRETDHVRAEALDGLLEVAAERALEPGLAALSEQDAPLLQVAAARCLGAAGDSLAVPALERALADPDRDVRGAALEALVSLGVLRPAGLSPELVQSVPLASARRLVTSLAEDPRAEDRPIHESLLGSDVPEIRDAARRGLARLK
ncbi:MAG: HEAT repeat domain-containing protein [Planctomycetes bacterium]|nr:HEAT repeat domain-containing protein [Planctomycetota bacterium]